MTNARAESINAGIQKMKYSARGFRNRKRFRNGISAALISTPSASPGDHPFHPDSWTLKTKAQERRSASLN